MKLTKTGTAKPTENKDTITDSVLQFPKYIGGGQFLKGAERHYEGWYKGYRVIAILTTRRKKDDSWGKGKVSYAIDPERKVYPTVEELCAELDKRTLKIV